MSDHNMKVFFVLDQACLNYNINECVHTTALSSGIWFHNFISQKLLLHCWILKFLRPTLDLTRSRRVAPLLLPFSGHHMSKFWSSASISRGNPLPPATWPLACLTDFSAALAELKQRSAHRHAYVPTTHNVTWTRSNKLSSSDEFGLPLQSYKRAYLELTHYAF